MCVGAVGAGGVGELVIEGHAQVALLRWWRRSQRRHRWRLTRRTAGPPSLRADKVSRAGAVGKGLAAAGPASCPERPPALGKGRGGWSGAGRRTHAGRCPRDGLLELEDELEVGVGRPQSWTAGRRRQTCGIRHGFGGRVPAAASGRRKQVVVGCDWSLGVQRPPTYLSSVPPL